ncbi:MAG: aminomethyltransferase [Zhongshania sp.]
MAANLLWAISKVRRPGQARAGHYPGAHVIAQQLADGVTEKRILLDVEGRAPVREGAEIVNAAGESRGRVTSGGFGPSSGGPVVMAYVSSAAMQSAEALFASVRGKLLPVSLRTSPFVEQRYFRG